MRRSSLGVVLFIGLGASLSLAVTPSCGGKANSSFPDGGAPGTHSSGPGSGTGSSSDSGGPSLGGDTGALPPSSSSGSGSSAPVHYSDGGVLCPTGLKCDVSCTGGGTTTVTGKVYDPAGKDPLYNVAVYVPATALTALPKGVPTGADACSCGALFPSGALTNATTAVDGSFTLKNVPVGTSVPLVLQVGKWRRALKINVNACQDNAQADKSLTLPGTVAAGSDDSMPDIAVSTGEADSLECLLVRIGVAETEYVAGSSTSGHVHIFSGGGTSSGGGHGGGAGVGKPEKTPMSGAPSSPTSLWDKQADLMPYDVVLLSCEGGETYDANPQALEAYLNAGGRAFGSHFHYAWFSGPVGSGQSYTTPSDWGTNLATWTADTGGGMTNSDIGGVIDQTLNGSTKPFPKGVTLSTWLDENGALGTNNLPVATELAIYQPRYNASVGATNTPSQPWITADSASGHPTSTMYFSFDTPVNAPIDDAGSPAYCGRAVFSDLHVAGNPMTSDDATKPPPSSCDQVDLSPQEKALEFMLFDLSSCVVPDTIAVPVDAGLPPPPPPPSK
jgi:hypothetical protein